MDFVQLSDNAFSDMNLSGAALIRRRCLFEPRRLLEEIRYLETESNCECSNPCYLFESCCLRENVKPNFQHLNNLICASHPSKIKIMKDNIV